MRRRLTPFVMAGVCLLTVACVPGRDGDPTPEPAGRGLLTQEQLEATLPRDGQLPPSFTVAEAQDDAWGDAESTTYPASCTDTMMTGYGRRDLRSHEQARASTDYEGEHGGILTVTVSTHDAQVPDQLFADAGAAQSQCGTFDTISQEGRFGWKSSPVVLPPIGDHNYSTRVVGTTPGDIFEGGTIQVGTVSVGHNLVHVFYSCGPESAYDPLAVPAFLETTVANLTSP